MMWGGRKVGQRIGARGQSTLEYILVLAAILVAVIVAVNSFIRPAIGGTGGVMDRSGEMIKGAAGKLKSGLGL